MAELTMQDVGAIVKRLSDAFINHGKKGVCVADKKNMTRMVQNLSDYTDEVQRTAEEGAGGLAGMFLDAFGGGTPGQWTLDMARWRERLAGYQSALEAAKHRTGPESCKELVPGVIEPLLLGWYQEGTPGILNPKVQTVPDVATPYMLGNQILTLHEFAKDNFDRFVSDMIKNAKRLVKTGIGVGKWVAGIAIVGGIAFGGYYLAKEK